MFRQRNSELKPSNAQLLPTIQTPTNEQVVRTLNILQYTRLINQIAGLGEGVSDSFKLLVDNANKTADRYILLQARIQKLTDNGAKAEELVALIDFDKMTCRKSEVEPFVSEQRSVQDILRFPTPSQQVKSAYEKCQPMPDFAPLDSYRSNGESSDRQFTSPLRLAATPYVKKVYQKPTQAVRSSFQSLSNSSSFRSSKRPIKNSPLHSSPHPTSLQSPPSHVTHNAMHTMSLQPQTLKSKLSKPFMRADSSSKVSEQGSDLLDNLLGLYANSSASTGSVDKKLTSNLSAPNFTKPLFIPSLGDDVIDHSPLTYTFSESSSESNDGKGSSLLNSLDSPSVLESINSLHSSSALPHSSFAHSPKNKLQQKKGLIMLSNSVIELNQNRLSKQLEDKNSKIVHQQGQTAKIAVTPTLSGMSACVYGSNESINVSIRSFECDSQELEFKYEGLDDLRGSPRVIETSISHTEIDKFLAKLENYR